MILKNGWYVSNRRFSIEANEATMLHVKSLGVKVGDGTG